MVQKTVQKNCPKNGPVHILPYAIKVRINFKFCPTMYTFVMFDIVFADSFPDPPLLTLRYKIVQRSV